jgi:hypothetical protein
MWVTILFFAHHNLSIPNTNKSYLLLVLEKYRRALWFLWFVYFCIVSVLSIINRESFTTSIVFFFSFHFFVQYTQYVLICTAIEILRSRRNLYGIFHDSSIIINEYLNRLERKHLRAPSVSLFFFVCVIYP